MGARWNLCNPMIKRISLSFLTAALLCSCSTKNLLISGVNYQSIRTEFAQPSEIPSDAKIAVEFFFNYDGEMQPVVYNLTDEVMTIDQTKSFVIMPDGQSVSYYDPNTYSSTEGSFSSQTNSSTLNLGAVTSALGIGGPLGTLAGGISVGNSDTNGSYSQNTVTRIDQPKVNIGPKGRIAMSKAFKINGIGRSHFNTESYVDVNSKQSAVRFSVCVSYSVDDSNTFEKLVTNLYVSSNIYEKADMKNVSSAFNNIYKNKPDALVENMFMFLIPNNIEAVTTDVMYEFLIHTNINDSYVRGSLVDFQ